MQRGQAAGDPVRVEITAVNTFGGQTYHQITGFTESPAWVRYNASGELVQYDPSGGPDKLWYPFAAPDGFSFRTNVPAPCLQQAALRLRRDETTVPAGTFSPVLAIAYQPGACADAGYSEELFVLGVGMIRRTAITIAGPRSFELLWARVNGQVIAGPEVSFQLHIDRPVYVANLMPPVDPDRAIPVLTARFGLRNTGSQPVTLQFNSGQRFDLVIRDARGQQVYQWAAGKLFTQERAAIEVKEGEFSFVVQVRLGGSDVRPFAQGRYTLEAFLSTAEGKVWTATVPFEVQQVF